MNIPADFKPVLALIEHVRDIGTSTHYEVVYYDNDITHGWKAYSGSDTFLDGERVLSWEYCDKLELTNN